MEQTPLVKTIQSLKPTETRAFRKFLQSPFFNQRADVLRLFEHILSKESPKSTTEKQARKATISPDWSKKAAFDHVFEAKSALKPDFEDSQIRHVMSFLFLNLKTWLAWNEWSADENLVNLAVCRALKKRGLNPVFEKELKMSQRFLTETTERSTDFLFLEYQFALENWEFSRKTNRGGLENMALMGDSFGAFVAATVLRQGCAALAKQAVSAGNFELPFLEETLVSIEKNGAFTQIPVVQLYFRGYLALKKPDDEANFLAFSTLLKAQSAALSPSEMHELWMIGINFCIRKLNAGARDFIREAFELYRTGLEKRIILEDGILSKFTWKNVLNLGLALDETTWCRAYLDDFKPFLPEKDRETVWKLGLATWHFRAKDYDAVLELLRNADFRDPLSNLDARRMILRIYFERNEILALESLLDSFRIYLRRHRVDVGYHRESFQNLISFVRRLIKLDKDSLVKLQILRDEILNTQFLAEREWLLGLVEIAV